jgi:integrase
MVLVKRALSEQACHPSTCALVQLTRCSPCILSLVMRSCVRASASIHWTRKRQGSREDDASSQSDNPNCPLKLKPATRHRAKIGADLFLDYRRPKSGPGTRSMKRHIGGGYSLKALDASADDLDEADGVKVLSFNQACERARERAKAHAERERLEADGPIIIARIIAEYIDEREARWVVGAGHKRNARNWLAKHVLSDKKLAEKPMAPLTADDLARWREGLKVKAPQRIVADFKAALNAATRRYRDKLQGTIRDTIKDGLASTRPAPAVAREAQALSDADVRRLVAAAWDVDEAGGWEGGLGRFVLALAATGARFSQLVRMTVADVQPAQRRLMIPTSRKGRRSTLTHVALPVAQDVIDALAPAVNGRVGADPLFLFQGWRRVGPIGWERSPERRPWTSPDQLARHWAAVIARAGLPASTVPYSLRHSSIVRGLRAGLPTRLVAQLHNTSSAMIEAHYIHHIADALGELAERAVISLSPATVTPIAAVR